MAEGFSLEHQSYPYHHYELVTDYAWSSGNIPAPISYVQGGTSTETTAKSVNVSKPQGRKTVTFLMRRQGAKPQVPDPTDVSENEELLSAACTFKDPKLDAEGATLIYEAQGRYEYLLRAPIFVDKAQYPAGKTIQNDRQTVGDLAKGGIDK